MNAEIEGSQRFVDRLARNRALDPLADAVQPLWQRLLRDNVAIKNLLSGTWLGHALHPILTDVPIGAWTVTAVSDALELGGVARFADAGDFALAIGTAGASAAALTGWADWSDTKDDPKRLGVAHAALNGIAISGYLGSMVLRARGERGAAAWLSLASYGLVSAAAYLGGELSTGMQLGVKHTVVPAQPPEDFVAVCDDRDLQDGALKRVHVSGVSILLARVDGSVSAIAGACTHRGGPLDEGERDGDCVRCPWHGARFDLRTGVVLEGPATFPLTTFETRVERGRIEVRFRP